MSEIICKCGAIVPDEKIHFSEGFNSDGDEMGHAGFKCNNCGIDYFLVGFVCVDTIEDAKEWLSEDSNWLS